MMAPWLALTTDGMLLAALVVIWVRRHHREPVGVGPSAAFWAGMAATIAANLAAAQPTPVGIVVALWPPVCLAITLELIALVASPTKHHPITGTVPAERPTHVPNHAQPAPGQDPAVTGLDDQAPATRETGEPDEPGHATGTDRGHGVGELPAGDLERVPIRVPTSPAPDPRHAVDPAGPVPAPASEYGPGTEPAHESSSNGHHEPPVRTTPHRPRRNRAQRRHRFRSSTAPVTTPTSPVQIPPGRAPTTLRTALANTTPSARRWRSASISTKTGPAATNASQNHGRTGGAFMITSS
jgi:hypothetical protein